MEVTNHSIMNPILINHHHILPKNFRALIVGKSSSDKSSTLLYNLILKPRLNYMTISYIVVWGSRFARWKLKLNWGGGVWGADTREQMDG